MKKLNKAMPSQAVAPETTGETTEEEEEEE
jgi:hypothetical protein